MKRTESLISSYKIGTCISGDLILQKYTIYNTSCILFLMHESEFQCISSLHSDLNNHLLLCLCSDVGKMLIDLACKHDGVICEDIISAALGRSL
jgi:hypothetical protein